MEEKNIQMPSAEEHVLFCRFCKKQIPSDAYFCPHCGKKLRDKPPATDALHQIGLYLFSILLPPLGLIPAIRYLQQDKLKTKVIGIIAIALTVVVSVIAIYYVMVVITDVNKQLNSYLNPSGY